MTDIIATELTKNTSPYDFIEKFVNDISDDIKDYLIHYYVDLRKRDNPNTELKDEFFDFIDTALTNNIIFSNALSE